MCSVGVANQRRRVIRARFLALMSNQDSDYSLTGFYLGISDQIYHSAKNYHLDLTYVSISITHICALRRVRHIETKELLGTFTWPPRWYTLYPNTEQ